jgi:hypothetical protein
MSALGDRTQLTARSAELQVLSFIFVGLLGVVIWLLWYLIRNQFPSVEGRSGSNKLLVQILRLVVLPTAITIAVFVSLIASAVLIS